ncbi:hypothetical protein G6L37_00560 [Agrobacterium rubi]|nr:hypothetical protein [Agrobacterium rubi]NTF23881.1 hypothetical protein [Agrobacterium rubi]
MSTRAEHVRWCKQRALEYIDLGIPDKAMASMVSDMGKHPDTVDAIREQLASGVAAAKAGSAAVKRWIENFSE